MSWVLDASVGAKWFIEEPDSALAVRLLAAGQRIVVPDLFAIEIAASWAKRHRGRLMTSPQLDRALTELRHLMSRILMVEKTSHLIGRSTEMSRTLHHSLYDCIYLALAEETEAILITADEVFVRKVAASDWSRIGMALAATDTALSPAR